MNATLICPSDRAPAAFFARQRPLALVPLLGRTALDRAMARLAQLGYKQVHVLAADRPEQIRAALREGKPWGVQAEVVAVPLEPRHLHGGDVFRLDHEFSQSPAPLWESPAEWFEVILAAMPQAATDTVSMRELQPGVWVSTSARISPRARLEGPCWIGRNAWIGAGSIVGPRTVIEEGACVDGGAEIVGSFVGPDTYVGNHLDLRSSLAWGRGLLDWRTGSFTEVTDAFLLADLSRRLRHHVAGSLPERLLAALMLVVTSPVLIFAWLRCLAARQPLFTSRRGVRAPVQDVSCAGSITWHELNGVHGMLCRWPELWSIARGDFRWIGNRPLSHAQAELLTTEFERLWLSVAPGLLSLADAEGDHSDHLSDSARAHAAYYAARTGWRTDLSILTRWLRRTLTGLPSSNIPTACPISQT